MKIKCSKCGEPKLESEFYRGNGHTCKECVKMAQKKRIAEKKEARKKLEWGKLREYILNNYGEANVEVDGEPVVIGGEFVGEHGKMMFREIMLKHRAWMRKKHLSESGMVPDKTIGVDGEREE